MSEEDDFKARIEAFMAQVPVGEVTTYGDLAGVAGQATASRVVGGIAHYGDSNLPWHRLVNRFGGLAAGFPGGREAQAQLLKTEGVDCENYIVKNFEKIRWNPHNHTKGGAG